MPKFAFPPESLSRAATLVERVANARAAAKSSTNFDAVTARREVDLWRAQKPFDTADTFAARLALDGILEAELLRVLGEDLSTIAGDDDAIPEWAREIEAAFESKRDGGPWSIRMGEGAEPTQTLRFLDAIEPLVRAGRNRLSDAVRDIVRAHPDAPFDVDSAVMTMLAPLPWTLHTMLLRAMVLELNVARMQGTLTGATPAERFEQFAARLRDPARAFAFLVEYPVLARIVQATIAKWAAFAAEFLGHMASDWSAIVRAFPSEFAAQSVRLARVDGGAGDAHRDGRSVIVAHFEGGARLVYKPRSLAVDVHFQELLRWINARIEGPALRTLAVLDRGDHGWVEFVVAAPCASAEGVQRFYRRQGALIAVLHALEAIDFHFENLIASAEDPVLIDLESLFHARFDGDEPEDAALRLVAAETARSVQRIGILPQKIRAEDGYAGVDLSGLAGKEGQLTPQKVLQWSDSATDEMHARRERVVMPGGRNLPTLADSAAGRLEDSEERTSVIRYERELKAGFTEIYRLFLEQREELLSDDGPIARFADDSVRCVLRPTHTYGVLLSESFHPDYLRDGIERERFLDRIWMGMLAARHLKSTVEHERADLANGDIPVFTTTPRSRDLWSSRGTIVRDVLPKSGLDLVRDRLRSLSERDLERQLWFIHASLATLEISRASLEWSKYPEVVPHKPAGEGELRVRLVDAATKVGDRLIALALRDERDVAWMGLQYDDKSWTMVPLLEDLYSGVAGVIHFLAHLGAITGEERFTEIARAAFRTYRSRLDFALQNLRVVGTFSGLGGAIWVLAHWSRVWNEPQLASDAHGIIARVSELLDEDEYLDVIGGSAGLIVAVESLHCVAPDRRLVELMRRAGDRIVARAKPMKSGAGWFTRIDTDKPITGFSHGAAGFSWALCRLYALTGDERYRRTALDAVLYERSMLIVDEGNWLEISKEKLAISPEQRTDGALSVAWCYGAPGVGLGRLDSIDVLDHPFVREDVDIALRTTLARGFGRNHSICHGDLGNLEFVMSAARKLGDARLSKVALEIQSNILASMDVSGFLCGVPLGVESPSLMNGLAGIGYGLLRAAHPDRVPSVLTLGQPMA